MTYNKQLWFTGFIAVTIFILDRLTKIWAYRLGDQEYRVDEFLSYKLVFNRGGTWGLFDSDNTLVFVLVSCAVVVIISVLMFYMSTLIRQKLPIYSVACLLAGGLGNLTDRIFYGGVIDFIYMHYHSWAWPTFNLADVVICISLVHFLLEHD